MKKDYCERSEEMDLFLKEVKELKKNMEDADRSVNSLEDISSALLVGVDHDNTGMNGMLGSLSEATNSLGSSKNTYSKLLKEKIDNSGHYVVAVSNHNYKYEPNKVDNYTVYISDSAKKMLHNIGMDVNSKDVEVLIMSAINKHLGDIFKEITGFKDTILSKEEK